MTSTPPTHKRCQERRAHYAHEWYNPFRIQCPGGPDETSVGACWHDSGVNIPMTDASYRCEFRAGHAGAHECQRGSSSAVWPNEIEESQ